MKALFDSDVLIDYLLGEPKAKAEIQLHDERLISIVSWAEVMVGAKNEQESRQCRDFLAAFSVVPFDEPIAEEAVRLRQAHRMKLPDAIVWASARRNNALLVTRNTKDFPRNDPGVRIPYAR
ncbi:MAG TPA: type II toxin-antitoxin system VapC family toxin [Opitutales bacterium]|nr:type II toxin-antitoxin system VapC family toxin [Opitutales bacterium]